MHREYVQRAMDGLRCAEKTMREVLRGGIIYHGSFNAAVISLYNELHQVITVIYDNNYQTEHQDVIILDKINPTLDQYDIQIQACIYVYTFLQ